VLRPPTTRVPAFGLLAEREGDSNSEALRLQKRLRFLTEVPIRIRQVRHINGSLLFRVSRLVLGSRHGDWNLVPIRLAGVRGGSRSLGRVWELGGDTPNQSRFNPWTRFVSALN
jgi:hypothetical protein